MKKFVIVVLVLLLAGYIYWPYHTVGKLEKALQLADRETIEKLIDFPAVRQSLKAQMAASRAAAPIQREAPANSLQQQMLKSAGLLSQFMTDSAIDSFVTAERVTEALKANRTLRKDDEAAFDLSRPSWTGLNSCTVAVTDKTLLKLRLAGLDGWRVVGVETKGGLLGGGMPIPTAP